MGGINVGRWLLGGVLAGILMFVFEGISSFFYFDEMQASMAAHDLAMDTTAVGWIIALVMCLLAGLVAVFFYAAARPRFGPGPHTAILVATVYFVGSYLLSLAGYRLMDLFSTSLLVSWGVTGYVETVLGTMLGALVYRET